LYFALENFLITRFSSVNCVREDAAKDYQSRFPSMSDRVRFMPTWVDTNMFNPPDAAERIASRHALLNEFGFGIDSFVLITVGRLDKQKSPLLLIDAFRLLHGSLPDARLLLVGDGVLRPQIEDKIRKYGLESAVVLCGVKQPPEVARYMHGADLFVLSSAYEGMPISVLEALGSGVPVASTDVGEVARVVKTGTNGELISNHDADSLAKAVIRCRENIDSYRGKPCTDAIQAFTPATVLQPIYDAYRQLAANASVRS
jgi:glycosyltransferase involved in cell wall biosynthesis